jgi:hypothetical protein
MLLPCFGRLINKKNWEWKLSNVFMIMKLLERVVEGEQQLQRIGLAVRVELEIYFLGWLVRKKNEFQNQFLIQKSLFKTS